jgi:hypothetical protein
LEAFNSITDINPVNWRAVNAECAKFVETHYATIRALLTEPQWRTIDSAPRNGVRILVSSSKGAIYYVIHYKDNSWKLVDGIDLVYNPSYWMPLPKAPQGIIIVKDKA